LGAKDEKKKKSLLLIILFFIILITIVSNTVFKSKINDLFFRQDKSLQLVNNLNINWPEQGRIKVYDNNIIKYEGNTLAAFDLEGNQIWKEEINRENSLVYLGEDKLYVAYKNSGEIIAYGLNGIRLWTYDAMQELSQISERNGYLILFMETGETIEQINIVNSNGKLKANTTVNMGSILSCNISPKSDGFVLTTLDISNGQINSNLIYYDMNGQEIWKDEYTDQIIYDVLFLGSDNMIVVYNNKIANISLHNELMWSRDVEGGVRDIEVSKKIYLLHGQENPILETISFNGRTVNKLELTNDFDNIYTYKGDVFISGSKNIAGVDDEGVFLKYDCEEDIKGIGAHGDNIIIFTSQGTMITETIRIKTDGAGD